MGSTSCATVGADEVTGAVEVGTGVGRVGARVLLDGCALGASVGLRVGLHVRGARVGVAIGSKVGVSDGAAVGSLRAGVGR